MIYFETQTQAEDFADKNEKYSVVNMEDNPSKGRGWIWAVKVV